MRSSAERSTLRVERFPPLADTGCGDELQAAIRTATQKAPAYTAKTLRDRPVVQSQLARAEAAVCASRAYLYDVFEEAWQQAVAARPITMDLKARMQLASTHAVHTGLA